MTTPTEWVEITRRNARSVQTTIGWIFWDPGAVKRYDSLGLPGPLGYVASACRAARTGRTGRRDRRVRIDQPTGDPHRVRARRAAHDVRRGVAARDEAVSEGLPEHTPGILGPLAELGPALWPIVERLPRVGRVLFAAHLRMPRSQDPVLSGWHTVNCIREWRGDLHWAVVVAHGLTGVEASILHNAWLGYERDWLARSRGTAPDELEAGWRSLAAKGLVVEGEVTAEGVALRERIENETDRLSSQPWELLGVDRARRFAIDFEPPCELLLARVDATAGPNYQPASRLR